MRDAGIVAGRLHPVMAAERGVALGLVLLGREIAIGGRQPVGAVLAGNAAELPERFLQALGQRGEALAAANRLDVLPAPEGEPEMVEQMLERLAGDRHGETAGMGEVGQRLATGRMLLPEDQLALGTLGRPPVRDAALQRAQQPIGIAAGMKPLQLLKQRRGAQARHPLQDRHQLRARHRNGSNACGSAGPDPLARQYRVLLDPPRRALAETGACRRRCLTVPSLRESMYRLTWWSVMCFPGIGRSNLPWRQRRLSKLSANRSP